MRRRTDRGPAASSRAASFGGEGVARRLAAAVALALSCGGAHAIGGDDLRARVGYSLLFDSNLFRLPEDTIVPGVTSRSEMVRALSGGFDFDRSWSAQQFRASVGLRDNRYTEYPGLDGLDYSVALGWTLFNGDRNSLAVDASRSRATLGFADVRIPGRPVVDTSSLAVRGALEIVPRWSALAAAGVTSTENAPASRTVLDYRLTFVEAGARHDWMTGSTFDFVWRRSFAEFPNSVAGLAFDNGYDQDDVGVRMTWRISEATTLSGRAGLQHRSYRDPRRESFTGPGVSLTADWRPRGGLAISSTLRSELSTAAEISATYAQLNGLSTAATWAATGKTSVRAGIDLLRRDFRGDAVSGLVGATRRDDIVGLSVGVAVRPWRTLELGADLRWDQRDSTVPSFDFTARTLVLRAGLVF
jgi:hypothetical protein